jgi:hypothetical protein
MFCPSWAAKIAQLGLNRYSIISDLAFGKTGARGLGFRGLLPSVLLYPGPRIPQRNRPVKNKVFGSRIHRVDTKISESLELVPASRFCICETRLQASACEGLQ